ncbi:hypothetical protein F383_07910 [Gossypium arboreum]|uniref:Uncharacterized protein n=1 Tax=Gossypium arboreum TaxID=29729 RepID=A0A0B0NZC1_GOSAR|nr:hypothetical protein F383_07910 [Gossypium arboreum]
METRIPRNPTIIKTKNSMNLISENLVYTGMIYKSRQAFNNKLHHIFFPLSKMEIILIRPRE